MNRFSVNKVVVPVDFSDASFQAVEKSLEMVDHPSQIHLLHVLVEMPVNDPGVIWGAVDWSNRVEKVTQHLSEQFADPRYDGAIIKVACGDPGHMIADYAQEHEADLIVIPSHGRTGLKRLLIGSVAERVVRLAHCPVLVLRR
ncbi:universal stress protein [Lignipirellula cremea]|uniref:Universal stress protein n=1 Tax=Lignipirellula cremea TaxID=2528010 RepID=A0A518E493_9BACT|nr:universal stress protein [Lignipirellula cremea]QDU98897.1 Universal stress protein [Lignipirellula cremea]